MKWASPIILARALYGAAWSTFLGLDETRYNAGMLLGSSIMRSILAPLLVALGLGVVGAVIGTVAAQISAGICFAFLAVRLLRRVGGPSRVGWSPGERLVTMLRYGVPLAIAGMAAAGLSSYYSLMISRFCPEGVVGDYSVAVKFTVLITVFSLPIHTVLFPAFSKLKAESDVEELRVLFRYAVKYTSLMVVPVATGVIAASRDIVWSILPRYRRAPWFLSLNAILYLYIGFGFLAIRSFLSGQGDTKVVTRLNLAALTVGALLGALMIPSYGVEGVILTNLVASAIPVAYGLWHLRRRYGVGPELSSGARIYAASAVTAAVIYALSMADLHGRQRLVLEVCGGAACYFLVAPMIGAIDEDDVENLRELSARLGPLQGVASRVLDLISYVFRLTHQPGP
ncbi:TPA: polysaccharide biosynthesis protein [Candidatus Bathyarchaeota archaeon]|nr:polysaccharide biosynthesis protein [Candidatus Bathyarchaeota archaeon]